MQRLIRLSFLAVILCVLGFGPAMAQKPQAYVSGRIAPGDVRLFQKDTVYVIDKNYVVGGSLIIEPGTTVYFYPNSRLIDSVGGRIIADGEAVANYIKSPDGVNPINTGSGYTGYADMAYFIRGLENTSNTSTVDVNTTRDLSVHPSKYNTIFNVVVDTMTRKIEDFPMIDANHRAGDAVGDHKFVVPFEQALMFKNARLQFDPKIDILLNTQPWKRVSGANVAVESAQINFIGQPVNNASREWGHIVVLPGARAAFFRNARFEGFKKDTTVDRGSIYNGNEFGSNTAQMNAKVRNLTNGGGGVITTMSSRTWLLNCEFVNNMARNRGGALQILQAPEGYPKNVASLPTYSYDKNPQILNAKGEISEIIRNNPLPAIDNIDSDVNEPFATDFDRQAWDDGRIALYLGRMRNLSFSGNKVQLANVIVKSIGGVDVVVDDTENPANYPQKYGNSAQGGAIYVAGFYGANPRQIEVGFGINNSIKDAHGDVITFANADEFVAEGNEARNYQSVGFSEGARGGAMYIGDYTSMILAGEFKYNKTYTKFLQDDVAGSNSGYFSMGGAVFHANTIGRLQVVGGPARDANNNATLFEGNEAGAGGAIFVDGNVERSKSPVIGGSDQSLLTRDYGFNIKFIDNVAQTFGGAVFSKRAMTVNGAGGVASKEIIGYGGNYPVIFENNKAGYAGGAIDLRIPNSSSLITGNERSCSFVRASFINNMVGKDITDDTNKPEIRGGGAIYALNADLTLLKGVEFAHNTVYNGNGGAICMVNPQTSSKRFFITDVDEVVYDMNGMPTSYHSYDDVFTYDSENFPPDVRMLTRFYNNETIVDDNILASQNGSGATQVNQGTQVTTSNIIATNWLDNNIGYGVGMGGLIVKFTNGGADWEYLNSGTGYRLTDVHFTDYQTGYVVGDRGVVLKTTNAGNTWVKMTTPVAAKINDIKFVGTNVAFAACDNGYILKTIDAGNTWTATQPVTAHLNSVDFNDGLNNGFIVGDRGTMLKTTNAGQDWILRTVAGVTHNLNSVFFKSPSDGYAVGENGIMLTTVNKGDNWSINANSPASKTLNKVYFVGQSTGYLLGQYGTFFKSVDGGTTWTAVQVESKYKNYSYADIFFSSPSKGYVVGDAGLVLTNGSTEWTSVKPADQGFEDVTRRHQEVMLPENGVGLGGALYILDSVTQNRIGRIDSVNFNRVRMVANKAFTGSAVYSDNYDLKLIFNRSLIAENKVDDRNQYGWEQNTINGPFNPNSNPKNLASSDLASATIYGEVQGPLPSYIYSEAANTVKDNNARFFVRLPDAPNSKGLLAGTTGIGSGGTDTLRGNYWGETQANLVFELPNAGGGIANARFETFFIEGDGETHMQFMYAADPTSLTDPRQQGPFESYNKYNYTPIPLVNDVADVTLPGTNSIKETLLMSGRVYDIYDKGTDIKTADYTQRRMSPIEDFAVGIAPVVDRYDATGEVYDGKYVRRLTRDPYMEDDAIVSKLITDFKEDSHPIGYPMFLETMVDYDGMIERSNHDTSITNETVFFVINETTTDYIRINMNQVAEDGANKEVFRGRVEFVPDSTNRTNKFLYRRNEEGLMNLGSGQPLLEKLARNPYNEDGAALQGRKYSVLEGTNDYNLGNFAKIYSNRPDMPVSNDGNQTYFAGERYKALPVNVGDTIRIVSRTVLWREGVVKAIEDGMKFGISESTPAPDFTGDVVKLQTEVPEYVKANADGSALENISVDEFKNIQFVLEDHKYELGNNNRNVILKVTAKDLNKFIDPRSEIAGDQYSELFYDWNVDPNTAASRWLMTDKVYRTTTDIASLSVPSTADSANGYMIFRGLPLNPFVVPGGEDITVTVSNFPPHYRVLDSLLAYDPNFDLSEIDKYIETYPEYFHAQAYDIDNARFLQQDTINFGTNYNNSYTFKLIVVDSVPEFKDFVDMRDQTNIDNATEVVEIRTDAQGNTMTWVEYLPSLSACDVTDDGQLKANLTDKLRFKFDVNTDDEMEDQWAVKHDVAAGRTPWGFPYGKTAYGFQHVAYDNDGNVIDLDIFSDDFDSDGYDPSGITVINKIAPNWISSDYMMTFDDATVADQDGISFTSKGQLNIRIDRATAFDLLTPKADSKSVNGALNLDTVMNIVVNDGHGALAMQQYHVLINIAPEIITETLANAKEDEDYNIDLLDSNRMIHVKDANFDQEHTFELIYDIAAADIPKDPCFPEAGVWNVQDELTAAGFNVADLDYATPAWLKINANSGLLFGTPGVTDAPKVDPVFVVVRDEEGLPTIKVLQLQVDSLNHAPNYVDQLEVICADLGGNFRDEVTISDRDLLRNIDGEEEELTIEIYYANSDWTKGQNITSKFNFSPATLQGPIDEQQDVEITATNLDLDRNPLDKSSARLLIVVTDKYGEELIIPYIIRLADPTDFVADITIQNSIGATKVLKFGTAPANATTGFGDDKAEVGTIDETHCEFELAPLPPLDAFDARWDIPNTNGVARNIYPSNVDGIFRYNGQFQPGGENGATGPLVPVTITWSTDQIPDASKGQFFIKDRLTTDGNYFSFNMKSAEGNHVSTVQFEQNGSECKITINDLALTDFVIVYDPLSSVDNNEMFVTSLNSVSPNPVSNRANVEFTLTQPQTVSFELIDILGNVVEVINTGDYQAGTHNMEWNVNSGIVSGTYTIRMKAGNVSSSMPVVLVK